MPATNYERIQQALHTLISAGPFYRVVTDPDTKLRTVDYDVEIVPAAVIVEEQGTSFGAPVRNRRKYILERHSWRWAVGCRFNVHVTAEVLEKQLSANPTFLPRVVADDLEQVILRLVSTDVWHPAQQNPVNGTAATFHFQAETSPV